MRQRPLNSSVRPYYEHAIVTSENLTTFRSSQARFVICRFLAVVVTLRGALGGKLSDRHLRLVRMYIEGGLLVTALALVPSLLNFLHIPDSVTWQLSTRGRRFDLHRPSPSPIPPSSRNRAGPISSVGPNHLCRFNCRGSGPLVQRCRNPPLTECRPLRHFPNLGPLHLRVHLCSNH